MLRQKANSCLVLNTNPDDGAVNSPQDNNVFITTFHNNKNNNKYNSFPLSRDDSYGIVKSSPYYTTKQDAISSDTRTNRMNFINSVLMDGGTSNEENDLNVSNTTRPLINTNHEVILRSQSLKERLQR